MLVITGESRARRRAEGQDQAQGEEQPCPRTIAVLSTTTEARPSGSGTHARREIRLHRLAAHRRGRRGDVHGFAGEPGRPEPGKGAGAPRRGAASRSCPAWWTRVGEADHQEEPPRERAHRLPDRAGADLPDHVSHQAEPGDQQEEPDQPAVAGRAAVGVIGMARPAGLRRVRPPQVRQAREPVALRTHRDEHGESGQERGTAHAAATNTRRTSVEEVAVAHMPERAAQARAHLDLPRELPREQRGEGDPARRGRAHAGHDGAPRGHRHGERERGVDDGVHEPSPDARRGGTPGTVRRASSPSEWSTCRRARTATTPSGGARRRRVPQAPGCGERRGRGSRGSPGSASPACARGARVSRREHAAVEERSTPGVAVGAEALEERVPRRARRSAVGRPRRGRPGRGHRRRTRRSRRNGSAPRRAASRRRAASQSVSRARRQRGQDRGAAGGRALEHRALPLAPAREEGAERRAAPASRRARAGTGRP